MHKIKLQPRIKETTPFDSEEMSLILETANMALGDGDIFDMVADRTDTTDEELLTLREKLYKYLNTF